MIPAKRVALATVLIALVAAAGTFGPTSSAEPQPPSGDELIRPLPAFVPTPTNWQPKYPFPYDQTRHRVTPADITAEGEMCQWYTAQYNIINDQLGRLQFNRVQPDGTDWDYSVNGVQQQVDIVTGNIDRALYFLGPRVQALTRSQNFAGDSFFPIYQGDSFYALWQQLSNVNNGIKAHQPNWFTGPSLLRMKKMASEINRSHVCD